MKPTFVFEDDKVYAMVAGEVVASGDDADQLEEELSKEESKKDEKQKKATHVITPNGVRGKILGTVEDVWGEEEVSVRLENGRIAHLKVADAEMIHEADEKEDNPIENFKKKLDEENDGDEDSLKNRKEELEEVKSSAITFIRNASGESERSQADEIVLLADAEISEIDERLDYLQSEEAEAFAPPSPFDTQVVEQAGVGPDEGGWLDTTLDQMIDEADQYDYEKMMDEGPESFVAELDEGVIDQPEAVHAIASSYIRNKTAAADPAIRDKYEGVWLARVESVRVEAVKHNTEKQIEKKEAAQKEEWVDAPDESLFD